MPLSKVNVKTERENSSAQAAAVVGRKEEKQNFSVTDNECVYLYTFAI
jgi:hypothetical protein